MTAMKEGVVKATSSLDKLKVCGSGVSSGSCDAMIQDPSTGEEVVLTTTITKQQPIEIFLPITVIPSVVVLLWQPGVKYRRTLKVSP